MFRILLTVYQHNAQIRQKRDGAGKRNLGRIGTQGKHRFAIKHTADLHAVKPACQLHFALLIRQPAFKRMRMPLMVQLQIGRLKRRLYPRSVLFRTRHIGAMGNHFFKTAVDRYPIRLVAQSFGERSADMQAFRHNHGSRRNRIPKKPTVAAKPRKNPLPIRRQQSPRIQIAADSDQAVAFSQSVRRVGETIILWRK